VTAQPSGWGIQRPRYEHRLRLPVRRPFAAGAIFGFLAMRAVPGVEAGGVGEYRRTLALPHGTGVIEVTYPGADWLDGQVWVDDRRDAEAAAAAIRWLFDTGADPGAIDGRLGLDPVLAPLIARTPGIRIPGHPDGVELAVRAVLGQQVSVAAARTVAARLAERYGQPLDRPFRGLTHVFPTAAALAAADPAELPMPGARKRALFGLTRALADGDLVLRPGAGDLERTAAALLALPGIGPWTVSYVRMRALGDRDAFLPTDIGVRNALHALGSPSDPRTARELALRWAPYRSYAMQHLWFSLSSGPRRSV